MVLSKSTIKNLTLSLVAVAVLGACHSGKTARTAPTTPTPTTPAPTPTALSLKVADGYLKGAFVFLDVNTNSIHDDGEPSGTTGVGGLVTLDTTDIVNPGSYPLIAIATKANTIDEDTDAAVAHDFAMSTPAGTLIINPITTMIQTKIYAALANGQTLSIEDAVAAVVADLGLTDDMVSELLNDYLVGKSESPLKAKLHALARNLVQFLNATPAELAAKLAGDADVLKTITQLILDAIAAGGDADKIVVVVDEGGIVVQLPEVADAKAFIADFRTWGAKIEDEINAPAASFGDKADAAELVVDANVDGLLIRANDVLMVVEQAIDAGTVEALTVASFTGYIAITDTDGVTVSDFVETDTTIKGMVKLELEHTSGDMVKLMIDLDAAPVEESTKSKADLMITGSITNTDASISITEASIKLANVQLEVGEIAEDLFGSTVEFTAMVEVASLKAENTGLFKGAVALNGKYVELDDNTDGAFKPTLVSLSGEFGTGAEKFDAMLKIESTGDFDFTGDGDITETATNWVDATATLNVSVDVGDFSGMVGIVVERTALDDGLVDITLTYGERSVILSANSADETGTIIAKNTDGVMMTLKTKNVTDGDVVGEVFLGIKKVGVITLVGSVHKIKYNDGSFETIF